MKFLINELKELMEEKGLSQTGVAKAMGVSSATLSLWLKGKYEGDSHKVEIAVRSFIKTEKERNEYNIPEEPVFVETTVFKQIMDMARWCHISRRMGVCYGDAGLGKTMAVKEYTRRHTDVILFESDPERHKRTIWFFRALYRAVGLEGKRSLEDCIDGIFQRLSGSGRLLIIDEAENLNVGAINAVRRLTDKGKIGILMTGTPVLLSKLTENQHELAPLYTRIRKMPKALPLLKDDDILSIIKSIIPKEAKRVFKTCKELCKGNARVLAELVYESVRVAKLNKIEVDAGVITEVQRMFFI